jgi:predicted metal-dependent HD superfamily phosphohydrolase
MQEILNKYGIKVDFQTILTCWNESHRHYHNQDHLYDLLERIGQVSTPGSLEYDKLVLGAIFHDIIYNPSSSTNEEDSANLLLKWSLDPKNSVIQEVKDLIISTKTHNSTTPLQEKFNKLDMSVVTDGNWDDLTKWEDGISKEYIPIVGEDLYKEGRKKFLLEMCDKYPTRSNLFEQMIEEYLK